MTKFKQGDRVVPERFENNRFNPHFDPEMEQFIGIEGEITEIGDSISDRYRVHGWFWPSSALRPASPKWEPVTGQEYYLIGSNQVVKYIGYNEESKEYVFYHKENDLYDAWLLEYIRPIAPSPEEELEKILEGVTFEVTRGETIKLIMQWHNRHKEGEGR